MRLSVGMVGIILGTFLALPTVHAADEDTTAEAAPVEADAVSREQILQEIEATRATDPELAAEMEQQFKLWESGQLDLTAGREMAFEGSAGATGGTTTGQGVPELIGPPVDGTTGMPSYMTPELQDQLSQVYDGVASGQVSEQEARAKAEEIMREHGIEPREMGPGHEGTGSEQREAFERAMEQMSPEAREQMERVFQEHEMDRETFEREYSLEHAFEAPEREQGSEAPQHEYEAPEHEYDAPEPGDGGGDGAPEYDAPPQP